MMNQMVMDTDSMIAQKNLEDPQRPSDEPLIDYFAAADTDEIAEELQAKVDEYYSYLISSNLAELWRRSYRAYYGMRLNVGSSGWGVFDVGALMASGDQGEIVRVKVNHFANLITHQLSMVCGERPALECRAKNSDAESLVSAQLGDGIVEYLFREKKLERNYFLAIETALVLSEAYVVLGWDATAGNEYGVGPNGAIVYDGDLTAKNFTPFQVIKDVTKNCDEEQSWYITHSKINKYDAVNKYAKNDFALANQILNCSSDQTTANNRTFSDPSKIIAATTFGVQESDDIPFMEFYHKKTPTLKQGRYTIFVNGSIKLFDGPLPFREVPVHRVTPRNIIGTPFGWTTAFDILGLQELVDKLYTVVDSNILGSGVQNFWSPPGNNVLVSQLGGNRSLIESMVKPEVLELLSTPAEVYNHIEKVEAVMETLMAVSAINRGDLPSKDMSGSAMAFLASQSISFNSGLTANANQLLESIGTGVVNILKDFAQTPRAAIIAGKQNRPLMKMYMGGDLESINNVVCESVSALSKTTTGKISIADNLLQSGLIKNPQEYLTLIKTGQMEPMTRGPLMENFLIQQENEWLLSGQPVIALRIDNHFQHIEEHKTILSSPLSRQDPNLVNLVLQHILEHEEQQFQMQLTNPEFLAAMGQQPLPFPKTGMQGAAGGIGATENPQSGVQQKAAEVRQPNQPNLPAGSDERTKNSYAELKNQQGH